MYLSRIQIRRGWIRDPRYQELLREGYATHEWVWKLFSDSADRTRDFVYRWSRDEHGNPVLFVVSSRLPDATDHDVLTESKPYTPQLAVGDLFEFSITANTVVKRRDENDKQQRHDLVLEHRRANPERSEAEAAYRVGLDWMKRQGESHGFTVANEGFIVDAHRTRSFRKRRGGAQVTLSTLEMQGILRCENPAALESALFKGVGPAKGYGCGLLLLRRLR